MTQYIIKQGYTEKEALAMTSMDLGMGMILGGYIRQVYMLIKQIIINKKYFNQYQKNFLLEILY